MELSEHILEDTEKRYLLFPLKYPKAYDFYKLHKTTFWDTGELDMEKDHLAYEKLDKNGLIPENTLVENLDIILGKVIPIKENIPIFITLSISNESWTSTKTSKPKVEATLCKYCKS